MSFLTPLYLLGALAIAGPVIAHLIHRVSKKHVPFSSLMFLEPMPPTLKSPRRVDRWPLLLLRCLALLALVAAFARPFWPVPKEEAAEQISGQRVLILLDTGASMQRDGVWDAAKVELSQALASLGEADEAAVWAYADGINPVIDFAGYREAGPRASVLVNEAMDGVSPGWVASSLTAALQAASGLMSDQAATDLDPMDAASDAVIMAQKVVVISDFSTGGVDTEGEVKIDWPKAVDWQWVQVGQGAPPTNAGVGLVVGRQEDGVEPRVRVTNTGHAEREQFYLSWADATGKALGEPVPAYVPAGQTRLFALPEPVAGQRGERLVLTGDDHAFDNVVYLLDRPTRSVNVWAIGGDRNDPNDALYFLDQAMIPGPGYTPALTTQPPARRADLVWIGRALTLPETARVREMLEAGATAWVMADNAEMAETLNGLLATDTASIQSASIPRDGYAMVGQMQTDHALLKPFEDPRFADFTAVRIWRHVAIDFGALPVNPLMSLDDGTPVLWEHHVGQGAVIVSGFGWSPEDSQLAISSKFVPLVHAALGLNAPPSGADRGLLVGEPVSLPDVFKDAPVQTPNGIFQADANGVFTATDAPGIYEAQQGDQVIRFAVNLNPRVSKTTPLTDDSRRAAGLQPPSAQAQASFSETEAEDTPEDTKMMAAAQAERMQGYWRWLLVLVMASLLIETLWVGRKLAPATSKTVSDEPTNDAEALASGGAV